MSEEIDWAEVPKMQLADEVRRLAARLREKEDAFSYLEQKFNETGARHAGEFRVLRSEKAALEKRVEELLVRLADMEAMRDDIKAKLDYFKNGKEQAERRVAE